MVSRLCDPEHLAIIILVLLVALLVVGSGKGMGTLLGPLFKRILGKGTEVNINLEGGEMGSKEAIKSPLCSFVDPAKCPSHSAEHERSLGNVNNIEKLFTAVSDLKKEIREGNERVLLALVAGGQIKAADIPPRQ